MRRPSMSSKSGCGFAISTYKATGRSRSAISASGSCEVLCSYSAVSSQPRSHPRALVKTPFKRSPGLGSQVKRTGKSSTAGKNPGMPAVFRSSNVSHDATASRDCAYWESLSLETTLSYATIQSSRHSFSRAKHKARNRCA